MSDKAPPISWTKEQLAGIQTADCNLLLSAAAGSGKTAVLAERCAYLVCDAPESQRCDVDEMLVVTFNEAAATQVKSRIEEALRRRLDTASTEHAALLKQLALIERAPISTLHSFCSRLLGQHFHRVELDPDFTVIDAEEAALLRNEVVEDLFFDRYEKDASGAFAELIDGYGDGSDDGLRASVVRTYLLLRSVVDPEDWLAKARRRLVEAAEKPLHQSEVGREMLAQIDRQLQQQLRRCKDAQAALQKLGGFTKYLQQVDQLFAVTRELTEALKSGGVDALIKAVAGFSMPKKPCVLTTVPNRARAVGLLASARAGLSGKSKRGSLFGLLRFSSAQWQDGMRRGRDAAELYLDLVHEFGQHYQAAKQRLGGIDFSDMETLALAVLRAGSDGLRPSAIARSYQRQFKYVLVDEYQDINEVQDAILTLVARGGEEGRRGAEISAGANGGEPAEGETNDRALGVSPAPSLLPSSPPCLSPAGNLFCVGDVKQSIYRFRLAEPERFLERQQRYKRDEAAGKCIDLQKNFRSRKPLLDVLNAVFRRLMAADGAGIEYDQSHYLHAGLNYPDVNGLACFNGAPIELHVLTTDRAASPPGALAAADGDGEETAAGDGTAGQVTGGDGGDDEADLDRTEREATLVAARIKELLAQPMHIADKGAGDDLALRPIRYRDIVILLRATHRKSDQFAGILSQHGIPVYRESRGGYFESTEVRDMLCLLRLLDNPRQDIPLAAVLRSPLSALAEPENSLARVRLAYPPKRGGAEPVAFHEAVVRYATEQRDELAAKLRDFLDDLSRWRQIARQRPLAELVWTLYEETGHLAFCSGLPNGAQRRANLMQLHERARQFGNFSRQGLYRFMEFLSSLAEESAVGEPSVLSEAEDVVRIMTIHKAKGLEFPVVFVPDLGKKFNLRDCGGQILVDRKAFLGLSVADPSRRIRYPSMASYLVRQELLRQSLAEELRVLYVAMTRAREHLILVGTSSRKAIERWAGDTDASQPIPSDVFLSANTMLDWIGPVATALQKTGGFDLREQSPADLAAASGASADKDEAARRLAALANFQPLQTPGQASKLASSIIAGLSVSYEHEPFTHIPASQSVSEWTKPKRDEGALPLSANERESHAEARRRGGEKHGLAGASVGLEARERGDDAEDHAPTGARTEAEAATIAANVPADRAEANATAPADTATEAADNAALAGELDGPAEQRRDAAAEAAENAALDGLLPRPRFLTQTPGLSAADIGTATHLVLENLDFAAVCDTADIQRQIERMVEQRKLTPQQARHVDRSAVAWLMSSDLGKLIQRNAADLRREVAFNLGASSDEWFSRTGNAVGDEVSTAANRTASPTAVSVSAQGESISPSPGTPGEGWDEGSRDHRTDPRSVPTTPNPHPGPLPECQERGKTPTPSSTARAPLDRIMVRGRIDLLIPTDGGYAVVDYKTDRVWGADLEARAKFYEGQVHFYRRAIRQITGQAVGSVYLVFLAARKVWECGAESASP